MKIGPTLAADVKDGPTFADYVLQELGTPYPLKGDIIQLNKAIKDFFAANPRANWMTLCKTVDWAKRMKKHPATPQSVVRLVGSAFAAGALPELRPSEVDEDVEREIDDALGVENDPEWRDRFTGAQGKKARAFILDQWKKMKSTQSKKENV